MSAKTIAQSFYNLDLAKDDHAISCIHKDAKLKWHSSKGYTILDYNGMDAMLKELRRSFESFRYKISHVLEDNDTVTLRYTIYAASIERPDKEEALAHFITIWETKDGKLFKGFEISQLADDSQESLNSYAEIKV
ncbi:nuclear transport factor 2 family protein [Sediminibacter sp. Hel_I_10]|uniref:nuclear transport factor 2 family protein n=1 Tax=Sediminibacter sp. Hel_I_10 TaxID=1392490 RepID=UPI00047EA702|nr:nuclear transport factor 2 family protein [Sediminibacter sp. Hel_I_10]